jgi:hypothetical protein
MRCYGDFFLVQAYFKPSTAEFLRDLTIFGGNGVTIRQVFVKVQVHFIADFPLIVVVSEPDAVNHNANRGNDEDDQDRHKL